MPPSESLAHQIAKFLSAQPLGRRAEEIAQKLKANGAEVNKQLLDMQQLGLVKWKARRWSWVGGAMPVEAGQPLFGAGAGSASSPLLPPGRWTVFRQICRYYHDYVHRQEDAELTLRAEASSKDYRVVTRAPEWSAIECGHEVPITVPTADSEFLEGAESLEKSGPWLLCAAIDVVPLSGGDLNLLHPLVLVPVRLRKSADGGIMVRMDGPVDVNRAWMRERKSVASADADLMEIVRAALQSEGDGDSNQAVESGLQESAVVRACKEIASRKPAWVREELQPKSLAQGAPLDALHVRGVYNRALLVRPRRLKYAAGLAEELRLIADPEKVSDEQLDKTALGTLFPHEPPICSQAKVQPSAIDAHIAEYALLNDEQRQVIGMAMSLPLTVLTGPPGTGKSMTVAHVMMNLARKSRPVLLASRNHQALEAVEPKLNQLAAPPDLAVLRPSRPRDRVAEVRAWQDAMMSLLCHSPREGVASARDHAARELDRALARRAEAEERMRQLLDLQDEWAKAEAAVAECLRAPRSSPPERSRLAALPSSAVVATCLAAVEAARVRSPWWRQPFRALWRVVLRAVGRDPLQRAMADAGRLLQEFRSLGCQLEGLLGAQGCVADLEEALLLALAGEAVRRADSLLSRLRSMRSREELDAELDEAILGVHRTTRAWLQAWAAAAGSSISKETRKEFLALRAAIANLGEESAADRFRSKLNSVLGELMRKFSLWAVSNLSARRVGPLLPAVFDLVVLDEASQCDIPSVVPLLFRARRAMIVGDPMQLGHIANVGEQNDLRMRQGHGLVGELELERFSARAGGMFALADASAPDGAKAMLRAHYRCHPDIAGYCNSLFYSGRLRVMTSAYAAPLPGLPNTSHGIEWVDVQGAIEPAVSGCTSPAEALEIAKLVEQMAKAGFDKTLGVVTPFRAQADLIRQLVAARVGGAALERLQFRAHTVDGFQGDERDVILMSLCAGEHMPLGSRGFLAREGKRMNVAASRARLHLRIFGDKQWVRVCGISYIQALLASAGRGQAGGGGRPDLVGPEWEPRLGEAMRAAELPFHSQFLVCGHHVDFALLRADKKLAIEVDGETWHRDGEGRRLVDDLHRDRVLRDAGWKVVRFWVHQLRDDMDGCVEAIRNHWA